MTPGSVPWLLRHELRQQLRRWTAVARWGSRPVTWVGIAVLLHLAGFGVAVWASHGTVDPAALRVAAQVAMVGIATMMLSQALTGLLDALYGRRDLDWLRTTPVSMRRLLAVRLVGVVAQTAAGWLLFLGPVANMAAVMGMPALLAAYPALIGLAGVMGPLGAALVIGLVGAFGQRRARGVANGLAMAAGAGFVLASQSNLLPPAWRGALLELVAPARCGPAAGAACWPGQALLGAATPLAALLAAGAASVALAAFGLGRRFAAGEAATARPRPRRRGRAIRGGRSAAHALLVKDLRLLSRTPGALGRALYQVIYLLPAAVAIWRGGGLADAAILALPMFVAGGIAAAFVETAIAGDVAADLAATAPVPVRLVRRSRMLAAGLALTAVLAGPLAALAAMRPDVLPILLPGLALAAGSNLLLGTWRPPATSRTDLGAPAMRPGGLSLLGMVVTLAWCATAGLAGFGTAWAALPAGLAVLVLALARRAPA